MFLKCLCQTLSSPSITSVMAASRHRVVWGGWEQVRSSRGCKWSSNVDYKEQERCFSSESLHGFFSPILLLCCYYFKVCGSCETVHTAGVSKLWSRMEMSYLIHYVQWPCYFSFLFSVAVTALFCVRYVVYFFKKKRKKEKTCRYQLKPITCL